MSKKLFELLVFLLILKKKMEQIGVKFKFQRGFIKHGYYAIVDFHIPSRNICIEVDGGYHLTEKQQAKDAHRDKWLTDVRGQRVIRMTNEEAAEISVDGLKDLVQTVSQRKRTIKAILATRQTSTSSYTGSATEKHPLQD